MLLIQCFNYVKRGTYIALVVYMNELKAFLIRCPNLSAQGFAALLAQHMPNAYFNALQYNKDTTVEQKLGLIKYYKAYREDRIEYRLA